MATVDGTSALGIDFGTSNTVAVVARPGRAAEPLLFDGSPLLPSAVFAGERGLSTGRTAMRAAASDPARCEPHPKRCIDDGTVLLGDREYPVAELIAAVLGRVAKEAKRVLGMAPGRVALTHPAGWAGPRLGILRAAAETAGLPVPAFVAEPVAAAAFFLSLRERVPEGRHALVYDLGGGTCDVTLVRHDRGRIRVVATEGLPDVGGVDIDEEIFTYLVEAYPDHGGAWRRLRDPQTMADRRQRRMLREDIRAAKEALSHENVADLFLPVVDRDVHLTRDELETLALPYLRQTVGLVKRTLSGMEDPGAALARIFLTGGASRMPLVATELLRATGIAPVALEQPEVVVGKGALSAARDAAPAVARPHRRSGGAVPQMAFWVPPAVSGVHTAAVGARGDLWALIGDDSIHLWNHVTGRLHKPHQAFDGDRSAIHSASASWCPTGRRLALAYPGGAVQILEPAARRVLSYLTGHSSEVRAIAWSPTGEVLATGCTAGRILLWDVPRGRVRAEMGRLGDHGAIGALEFSPDGSALVVQALGACSLWSVRRNTEIFRHSATAVTWHEDGRLFEVSARGSLRLFGLGERRARSEPIVRFTDWSLFQLRRSSRGDRIAGVTFDRDYGLGIWCYSVATGTEKWWKLSAGSEHTKVSLHWTPKGRHLVTATDAPGRSVRVWNTEDGSEIRSL